MSKGKGSRAQGVHLTGATALFIAVMTVLAAPATDAAGVVVIDFMSPGGPISGVYTLNVSVTGDLEPGQVFYGLDTADPTTAMTRTSLYIPVFS